jgi:hypothetical protein
MINSPKSVLLTPLMPPTAPRQLSIVFDSIRLRGMGPSERAKVLAHLVSLLMLAAGAAAGGCDDDER